MTAHRSASIPRGTKGLCHQHHVNPFRGTREVVSSANLSLHIVERHIVCLAILQFALAHEIASKSFARNRLRFP